MLVRDSLVYGQGNESCRKNKEKIWALPWPQNRVHHVQGGLLSKENSKENLLFVTVDGTNNLRCDKTTYIVCKYRAMITEFTCRRRKIAVRKWVRWWPSG